MGAVVGIPVGEMVAPGDGAAEGDELVVVLARASKFGAAAEDDDVPVLDATPALVPVLAEVDTAAVPAEAVVGPAGV